ncbi:MAG: biotin transporter BioY [Candidatus Omnitrophica bacterium]|nr:biotin transporter BioY [Candidatus Omnitrophota bacterium]MDD5661794.1 biotin transporter BioY [Candidatus Omnitrophota bacterium]
MEAILKRELIVNKQLCRLAAVFFSVIFVSLGAFVRIPLPFTPVPLTLQTFFVLLSAGLLGRRLGLTAQLSYVLLGALGLPIFTNAVGGLSYFASPTAGYLFGFILATFFVSGFLKRTQGNLGSLVLIFYVGSIIILLSGSFWLKVTLGISLAKALAIGCLPFIPGDLLKALAVTFIYLRLKTRAAEIL